MFDQLSVRVVAGALLWSCGAIFLAIAAHGRVHGVSLYSEDVVYVRSLLRGIVAAAFFGAFYGGVVNCIPKPLFPNLGGAVIGGITAWLAPNSMHNIFPAGWPDWVQSVTAISIGMVVGAIAGVAWTLMAKRKSEPSSHPSAHEQ